MMNGDPKPTASFDSGELRARLAAVLAAPATRDASNIMEAIQRLEEYTSLHARELPAMLQHYLANRSYQKAWEYLSGETPAAGTCR